MRRTRCGVPLMMVWGGMALSAATIQYNVTTVGMTATGQTLYRYDYTLSDVAFSLNQDLDIRFDPTLFGQLLNGVAGPGFNAVVLQPNNPTQSFGDYSALAIIDQPPIGGPFSVDFTYIGSGSPASQPYFIDQFDNSGTFQGVVASGTTVAAAATNEVPEPASVWFSVAGFILGGVGWASKRNPSNSAKRPD